MINETRVVYKSYCRNGSVNYEVDEVTDESGNVKFVVSGPYDYLEIFREGAFYPYPELTWRRVVESNGGIMRKECKECGAGASEEHYSSCQTGAELYEEWNYDDGTPDMETNEA